MEYKTHWKGYSSKYDTWEPFSNFDSLIVIGNYWNEFNSQTNTKSNSNIQTSGK